MASQNPPRLDRAAHLRRDGAQLNRLLQDSRTRLVPVWRNQILLTGEDAVPSLPTMERAGSLVDRGFELVWLGLVNGVGCFAVDVSSLDAPTRDDALSGEGRFSDLRPVSATLAAEHVGLLKYARGILHWHRQQAFCGKCGSATTSREGGHVRECPRCETKHFPRTDPAVMVLITRDDRCVLARQPGFPPGMYSALAGFVEPGETIEECVHRESMEEVGVPLSSVKYFDSQSWPFPQSLMIGYSARAEATELRVDDDEIEEARWMSREELREPKDFFYPPPFSLAHHLIRAFIDDEL